METRKIAEAVSGAESFSIFHPKMPSNPFCPDDYYKRAI
jgi:hypothetical protein